VVHAARAPQLFLYLVTPSHLMGEQLQPVEALVQRNFWKRGFATLSKISL